MKKVFFSLALVCLTMSSCYERIDAGCEGIQVDLYGDSKGVDNVAKVSGAIWYNPITTTIYEYPTFVQTIDYPEFTINSKDGSEFILDPTALIKLKDGCAPRVFKKYRKEMNDIVQNTLYTYVKDACRVELNKYTTDYIVSHRGEVEKSIEAHLIQALDSEHFELEQLTTGLKYPQSIVDAVNAKTKAVQEAQRAENELAVAKAEAEKKIITAKAEAETFALKQKALSPLVIQQMWIEKWNGQMPTYTVGNNTPVMFNMK